MQNLNQLTYRLHELVALIEENLDDFDNFVEKSYCAFKWEEFRKSYYYSVDSNYIYICINKYMQEIDSVFDDFCKLVESEYNE